MLYKHTPDMGTISCIRDDEYEQACQDLLHVGVTFMREHDEEMRRLCGPGMPKNQAIPLAVELSRTMYESDPDATAHMTHLVMKRLEFIALHSWEEYVRVCRENAEHTHE